MPGWFGYQYRSKTLFFFSNDVISVEALKACQKVHANNYFLVLVKQDQVWMIQVGMTNIQINHFY